MLLKHTRFEIAIGLLQIITDNLTGVHSKRLTNGGNVGSPDLLVGELCDEARLPHSTVAA